MSSLSRMINVVVYFSEYILNMVNLARSQGAVCGEVFYNLLKRNDSPAIKYAESLDLKKETSIRKDLFTFKETNKRDVIKQKPLQRYAMFLREFLRLWVKYV